ncbi:ABC transporter permease [Reinekea marinisedimentorum]|uniref:Peptide/nickel transport system permease protein n=1 Tax=Reinekea marinisedimentorum TaxID=230495 RepID=A0A4R3IA73_9GAMM|nr:ABC transporter permease [Reinekea marinisedimentorum]TCS43329.1 peptide/nickel transport system permease protein [Reinekea marinisedimentorum]
MQQLTFLSQRLLQAVFVTLAVTLFVAFAIRFTGDPAVMMTQESSNVTEADLAMIRESLGLNAPFHVQYLQFMGQLLTGELGNSFFRGPIKELIGSALPSTLLLAATSMVLSILISIPLGIVAAVKQGKWVDQLIRILSLTGLSFPNFWLAMMLVLIFSITFNVLPVSGFSGVASLVLPSATVAIVLTAVNVRLVRTAMLDVLSEQYIMVARAKGVKEFWVIYKHALRNSAIALITFFGLQFGNLIGGIVVVERVFNWPGMGSLALDAIAQRDYPLLQASVCILAMLIVIVNLVTDMAYSLIDPRIRVKS